MVRRARHLVTVGGVASVPGIAWRIMLGACTLLLAGACMRIDVAQPLGPDRALQATAATSADAAWRSPGAWPERIASFSGVRRSTASSVPPAQRPRGVIREVPGPLVPMSSNEEAVRVLQREAGEDIAMLTARYRLREGGTLRVTGEGQGAYLFLSDPREASRREDDARGERTWLKFVSGRPMGYIEPTGDGASEASSPGRVLRVALQRTWMVLLDPRGDAPPRGLCVLVPGLFGTPAGVVDDLAERLRARGWAVLRLLSQPSRFTEQVTFTVSPTDPEASAILIADELTDRAAECAFAVQAACLWLRERRPALAAGTRVIVGMSGGAMVAPTVVAREPEAYSAAVLVAGGVNFLGVALDSSYASWVDSLRFERAGGGKVQGDLRQRLMSAYLEHATLDSEHTASALAGKPVLIVHASGDRAVPASLGERLWERTGRPERWVFDTGHELLFAMLPMRLGRMVEWIDEHAVPREGHAH